MPEFDPAETAAILEVYDHYEDPRSRDYSAVGLPLILLAFAPVDDLDDAPTSVPERCRVRRRPVLQRP